MATIDDLKVHIIGGGSLTKKEAYALLEPPDKELLFQ